MPRVKICARFTTDLLLQIGLLHEGIIFAASKVTGCFV
jgi:hypothetical protein